MKKPKDISDSLGQCQANLAQSILGWMGLKFVYTKGQSLFIIKQWKYVGDVKKSSWGIPRTIGPNSTRLDTKHPCVNGIHLFKEE